VAQPIALINGMIHTSWDGGSPAAAVLVDETGIVHIGTADEVRAQAPAGTRIIDLKGRSVLPAFTDSHTHFHRAAVLRKHFLDFDTLRPASVSDVLAAVERRAKDRPDELWIQGDNLSAARLAENRLPDRAELDRVSGDHPVVLRTVGKHGIAANSAALAAAEITAATPDPTGGRIERDAAGRPTGVLHETAKLRLDATRADSVVPLLDEGRRLEALREGLADLNRHGIAEIHEIVQSPTEMSDYQRLREEGQLTARVVFYVRVIEGQATLHDLTSIGLRTGFGDDWLRIGGIKVSIDGSCTLHNAALYEPYLDAPDSTGLIRIPQQQLDEVVVGAARAGLQVAVHAIGQRALDMALDSLALAADQVPGSKALRHRIEHGYLAPRPGQLERVRDLDVVISTQPVFLWVNGDTWEPMFGAAEADRMVPMQSLLDLGIPVQINTDFPNAPIDPLINVRTSVDRTTRDGSVIGTAEAVPVQKAWELASTASAFAAFEDGKRSALAVGQLADLIVVSGDPFEVATLDKLAIEATIVGGRLVHASPELVGA
jgi:predicted amidohydrolase YtcJ